MNAKIALSTQLKATARAVAFVFQGQSLSQALEQVPHDLRAGVQALSFAVMRQWGMAQALCQLLVAKKPTPEVYALLCTSLALMQKSEAAEHYTDFTLVNQTVQVVKSKRHWQHLAGLVNAALRRYLRERDILDGRARATSCAQYNYPQWWIDRVRQDHPEHWASVLQASQKKPPMSLRVNGIHTTNFEYAKLLNELGVACRVVGKSGIILDAPQAVSALPHYDEAWFSVQDLAAQASSEQLLSSSFLAQLKAQAKSSHQPIRVLDACAAPGGKTTHLLEILTQAQVPVQLLALDTDGQRSQRIAQNLKRLRLHAEIRIAPAQELSMWWDGRPFDAVLLDAPCSASGIVRRHPDIAWLRRSTDIAQLTQLQSQLLQSLWTVLKPKGRLLYATCSVFKDEGEKIVEALVEKTRDVNWLDSGGVWLPAADHDGFYDALLEKTP